MRKFRNRTLGAALRLVIALIVANEIRGVVMTAPVFYAMYVAGGSWMAIWLGICALGGIALSVIVPTFALSRLRKSGRLTSLS